MMVMMMMQKLIAERVQYKSKLKEHMAMVNKFIAESVAKEVKELHADKVAMKTNVTKHQLILG